MALHHPLSQTPSNFPELAEGFGSRWETLGLTEDLALVKSD